jgi:Pyridine nucleotide-disulphide oxidoreductase
MENHDVIIIGAGPAGLAAAIRLRERGVKNVVVLEREREAGGVPRHCGHFGFGWESHKRLMSGPKFAQKLVRAAMGIEVRTATTVLEFTLRNTLRVHSNSGISELSAKHVIVATGTRESSRAAQLIGGNRLPGVMNTGALQQHVYFGNHKPFFNPIIIGNEWVTFSALLTCRHAGIKPVGIFAEDIKLDVPWFFPLGSRLAFGVPVQPQSKLIAILGQSKVEDVEIEHKGQRRKVACDGVILSGNFRPENALLTSAPINVTRVGNVLGTVNTAGTCVVQARTLADTIAQGLI